MSSPNRLIVFDALMLRSLVLTETGAPVLFADELAAFRVAFRRRRFGLLLTRGILFQYQVEANKFPSFNLLPRLNGLQSQGRVIYVQEHQLTPLNFPLTGLPQEHQEFIHDALAARASYLVTTRPPWLELSEQTSNHGLQIIRPGRFVELEGP